ncbi:hypothetical protein LSTR_LSTR013193 [Laodelphax striatellus]|uniref:Uncharacterized protein n=1 Tax=Laodelphax striatellus TaxID=195883 RepID=A0A482WPI8_LAOST|nr:hypothetical protein LSTR_LSTR013193 [Laodelphax striatellus]
MLSLIALGVVGRRLEVVLDRAMDVAWNPEWNGRNQRWQASRKGSIQELQSSPHLQKPDGFAADILAVQCASTSFVVYATLMIIKCSNAYIPQRNAESPLFIHNWDKMCNEQNV